MQSPTVVVRFLIAYGIFLLASGIAGFEITHEQSTSSLVNGIVGGALMLILSVMYRQRRLYALPAAIGATGIFLLTFVWRAVVQWTIVIGDPSHALIAVLLSAMASVSLFMLITLLSQLRM